MAHFGRRCQRMGRLGRWFFRMTFFQTPRTEGPSIITVVIIFFSLSFLIMFVGFALCETNCCEDMITPDIRQQKCLVAKGSASRYPCCLCSYPSKNIYTTGLPPVFDFGTGRCSGHFLAQSGRPSLWSSIRETFDDLPPPGFSLGECLQPSRRARRQFYPFVPRCWQAQWQCPVAAWPHVSP